MKPCGKCGGKMCRDGDEGYCINCGNREELNGTLVPLSLTRTKGKGFHKFLKVNSALPRRKESGGNGRFREDVEFQEELDALEATMGIYVK